MTDAYDWAGGREAMLRFGPSDGPVVIASPALFEEANRTRAFLVATLRALAERDVASILPDLPGTGDSLVATEEALLSNWRAAFAAAAPGARYLIALRGGALVDEAAITRRCWHFAPVTGTALVCDMVRVRVAAAREGGDAFDPGDLAGTGPPIELAGNHLSRAMLRELKAAVPTQADRVIRLDNDPQPATRKLAGAPLWRRSEPAVDPVLWQLLAEDIAEWIATCGG